MFFIFKKTYVQQRNHEISFNLSRRYRRSPLNINKFYCTPNRKIILKQPLFKMLIQN